jgi:hypothetical protein
VGLKQSKSSRTRIHRLQQRHHLACQPAGRPGHSWQPSRQSHISFSLRVAITNARFRHSFILGFIPQTRFPWPIDPFTAKPKKAERLARLDRLPRESVRHTWQRQNSNVIARMRQECRSVGSRASRFGPRHVSRSHAVPMWFRRRNGWFAKPTTPKERFTQSALSF